MAQLEVLVVNDGSKDASSAIAHEYEKKYPGTFRVIDKENGNYGSCVNRGIDEATGKYLRLLDADDCYLTANFEKFIDMLNTADADMIITYICLCEDGSEEIIYNTSHMNMKHDIVYKDEDFDFKEMARAGAYGGLCSFIFRLDLLKRIGLKLQTGLSYTDTEYFYFPLAHVRTVLPIDLCVYVYTTGREGQTTSYASSIKSIDSKYKVANRIVNDMISSGKSEKIRERQIYAARGIITSYFRTVICFCKKDAEEEKRMGILYKQIKENIPEIILGLRKGKYLKILPYFSIWEKTGKYMTEFPYSIMNNVLSIIRILVKGKRK